VGSHELTERAPPRYIQTVTEHASMRLLSRSCTTGWFDWIWGELRLTPEGIARLSSGWAETRRMAREHRKRGGGTTVVESAADVDEISTVDIHQASLA
jgi:hypothetical protein